MTSFNKSEWIFQNLRDYLRFCPFVQSCFNTKSLKIDHHVPTYLPSCSIQKRFGNICKILRTSRNAKNVFRKIMFLRKKISFYNLLQSLEKNHLDTKLFQQKLTSKVRKLKIHSKPNFSFFNQVCLCKQ